MAESDPVQACKRLYEAAEMAARAMAKVLGIRSPSDWTDETWLDVIRQAPAGLKADLVGLWTSAEVLLVEGFYERRLKPGYIKLALEGLERELAKVEGYIAEMGREGPTARLRPWRKDLYGGPVAGAGP